MGWNKNQIEMPEGVTVEQYDHDRHYVRFAPLFIRYYREVNQENLEVETPVTLNGKLTLVKRYDAEIHGMALQGVFCKVAIVDDEIAGFIWYRPCLHHFLLPIDAFYVRREYRRQRVALALLNSFCNEFNRGWLDIVAFIHEKKRPEEMLKAFHGWEQVRDCNDRDLVMIRGHWDIHLYQKAQSDASVNSGEVDHVPIFKPEGGGQKALANVAQLGRRAARRKNGDGRKPSPGNGTGAHAGDAGADAADPLMGGPGPGA